MSNLLEDQVRKAMEESQKVLQSEWVRICPFDERHGGIKTGTVFKLNHTEQMRIIHPLILHEINDFSWICL